MDKVGKKVIALLLAFTFAFSSFIGIGTNKVLADEMYDYMINGKEINIDGEMVIYSMSNKINKDSVIEYETEDGEVSSFNSVDNGNEIYTFVVKADKTGVWTAKTVNGEEVNNDYLNFKVYSSEEEMIEDEDNNSTETIEDEEISEIIEDETNIDDIVATTSSSNAVVNRFSGSDRFATAVEVSKKNFSSSNNVVITNGVDFPDALAAVTLANKLNSPILFVKSNTAPSVIRNEIKRLGAKKAYIVGGTGSVNDETFNLVKASASGSAERISGSSRQETAIKVAEKTLSISGKMDTAILVDGNNYADALSAGPAAGTGQTPYPILFTNNSDTGIDDITKEFISKNINRVMIVGGTGSVSEVTKNTIQGLGKTVERISGTDRYDTSIKVANRFFHSYSDTAYMASGSDFADALAGGAVGAKDVAPLYLVRGDGVTPILNTEMKNRGVSNVNILGGTGSVSLSFEDSLKVTLGITSPVREKIVAEAKKQLGKPYVFGSSNPSVGFDCSGLIKHVYKQATGDTLYHNAALQATCGRAVSKSDLQPGDLVFFNGYSSKITHAGIYIGDGKMIHSPQPGQTVSEISLSVSYYVNTFETARNLID